MPVSFKEQLYAPFALQDHEVRELRTTSNGKVQWLAYIRREAIQNRLDDLFFGEWSTEIVEIHRAERYHSVRMRMTIRGITREFNGSQAVHWDKKSSAYVPDEHTEKGGGTDAFKRVASMFGIGLYLQSAPMIFTDGFKDGNGRADWNKKRAVEADAMKQLGQWLSGLKSIDDKLEAVGTAPVKHQSMLADSVETVFENNTPYILAGSFAYATTRQQFADAGYDTNAWTEAGVYPLEPHAYITYQEATEGQRGLILGVIQNTGG